MINIRRYGTLVVTGSATIDTTLIDTVLTGSLLSGSTLVYSINTGSYNAGFFDYYVTSGSNGRAGTVMRQRVRLY
jgi:hypothetical protein